LVLNYDETKVKKWWRKKGFLKKKIKQKQLTVK
jgi:hypothetical protein